jgi:hypothetical protein
MPRRPVPSVEEAVEIIVRAGFVPHEAWLDFHATFGGYQDDIDRDWAIWGITHFHSYWYGDREVSVEIVGGRQYIICAEVHPSYSFRLYADGTFYSRGEGFSTTFDVKVERLPLIRDITTDGRMWRADLSLTRVSKVDSILRTARRASGSYRSPVLKTRRYFPKSVPTSQFTISSEARCPAARRRLPSSSN